MCVWYVLFCCACMVLLVLLTCILILQIEGEVRNWECEIVFLASVVHSGNTSLSWFSPLCGRQWRSICICVWSCCCCCYHHYFECAAFLHTTELRLLQSMTNCLVCLQGSVTPYFFPCTYEYIFCPMDEQNTDMKTGSAWKSWHC